MRIPGTCRVVIAVLALVAGTAGALFADPVVITDAAYELSLLRDGRCEVYYRLTFSELESRNRINSIGPFVEPMRFLQSYGTEGERRFKVVMNRASNGFYSAEFDTATETGKTYVIHLRYMIERPVLDRTVLKGKDYARFWWSPIQWNLPIQKQTVRLVLPVEIPARYTAAKMIGDDLVKRTGLLAGEDGAARSGRWSYYPSQWKGKNHLSILSERVSLARQERQSMDFFLPVKYLDTGAEGGGNADDFPVRRALSEGVFSIERATLRSFIIPETGDHLKVGDSLQLELEIREGGRRNHFPALLRLPKDGGAFAGFRVEATVNGASVRARARGGASGGVDVLLERETKERDDVIIRLSFSRNSTLTPEPRLHNGTRLHARYKWPGLGLPVRPGSVNYAFHVQILESGEGGATGPVRPVPAIGKRTDWEVKASEQSFGHTHYVKGAFAHYPFVSVTGSPVTAEAFLPPLALDMDLDPARARLGQWFIVRTLVNDLAHLEAGPVDRKLLVEFLGTAAIWVILVWLANPLLLGVETALLGWPLVLRDRARGTGLFREIFFPRGVRAFSLTSGYLFGFNAVFVPFRAARAALVSLFGWRARPLSRAVSGPLSGRSSEGGKDETGGFDGGGRTAES